MSSEPPANKRQKVLVVWKHDKCDIEMPHCSNIDYRERSFIRLPPKVTDWRVDTTKNDNKGESSSVLDSSRIKMFVAD